MDCKKVKENIYLYSAGCLSRRLKAKMEEHLSTCTDCSRELKTMEMATGLVEKLTPEKPPAGMWEGVLLKIREQEQGKKVRENIGLSGIWEIIRLKPVPAVSVFVIIIFLIGGIYFFSNYSYPPQNEEEKNYFNEYVAFSLQDPLADKVVLNRIAAVKYVDKEIEE